MPGPTRPDLGLLIDDLDRACTGSDASTAFLARVTNGSWCVTTQRSLHQLVGWSAPLDCDAIGIVAAGNSVRAVPFGRDGSPDAGGPDPATVRPRSDASAAGPAGADPSAPHDVGPDFGPPVRLIAVVDRSGRIASRLRVDGAVHREPPAGGRMLDTLLRCLGRPTQPPDESTAGLLATLWFAAIMATGADSADRLTWTQAIRLHPAAQLLLASGSYFSHRELTAGVNAAAHTLTWEILRDATARRGTLGGLCPRALAAWMDAGIYSRWVLGQLPALETLFPATMAALRPATVQRVFAHVATSLHEGSERPPGRVRAS
jgi:hypothetical protein